MSRRNKNTPRGGQPNHTQAVATMDAFSNPLFRLGFASQSPLEATEYPLTRLTGNYALLNSLYRSGGLVQSVIDMIPEDMCREWFTIAGEMSPKQLEELESVQRRVRLREKILRGLRMGRLFGGAAGLILISGHENQLAEPLELDAVMPGAFHGIHILERWTGITPGDELVTDARERGFGLPAYYNISDPEIGVVARVHHSRIVRFTGRELPELERIAEQYWGESEIEPVYDAFVLFDNVMNNLGGLTFRANLDIMEVQNLDQLFSLTSTEQQRRFWNVMQAQSVAKSNFGLQLVNKGDQLHNVQYSFAGFDTVIEAVQYKVSADTHIPVTKLFGRSPAGMNSTGESDLQIYYNYIDGLRESKLRPVLEQILPVMCMSALGFVPDGLNINFPPLWTPTAKEVAEISKLKTETLVMAFQAGILSVDTVQKELKKLAEETGLFGSITDAEILKNRGKSYQDVTALRDPLAGLGYEAEEPDLHVETAKDAAAFDYSPSQPRDKNGRWTGGSGGGKIKMGRAEYRRVSSGILTDHPSLEAGPERYSYHFGNYSYRFSVNGPGDYSFHGRKKIR